MVSDALVQFGVGFADAFGRERKPYFDALAREEANKEITMGRNLDLATNIVSNSAKIPKEQQESVAKQLGASLNTASLYQVGALQAQGIEVFNISDKGAYSIGNNKFASISPLKTKGPTEAEKKRQVATRAMSQLFHASGDTPEEKIKGRRKVWNNLPDVEKAILTEYIYGGTGKVNSQKYAHAMRLGWLSLTEDMPGLGPEFGKYKPNESSPVVKSIMNNNNITDIVDNNSTRVTELIINSSQLGDEAIRFYANYLQGVKGMSEAHTSVRKDVNLIEDANKNIVDDLIRDESTGQVPSQTSSTQLYTNAGQNFLDRFTKNWFIENIKNASGLGYDTRALMLNKLQEDIFDRFSNSKWILGNGQDVKDAIMRFIAESYDEATDEMAP